MPAVPETGGDTPRRRRSWVPTLVAIDTVLVAAVLVVAVLVTRPDSPSPTPTAGGGPSASTPATTATPPAPAPTPGPPRFRLPSGNIACDMSDEGVTCTIASITFTPPPVDGCEGTVGHTVVLDAEGVQVPCVEGAPPPVAGDDVPVLFYGAQSVVGDYACTSATNGVTCIDGAGVGFRLQRASLTTLP